MGSGGRGGERRGRWGRRPNRRDEGAGEEGGGVEVDDVLRNAQDVAVRRAGAVSTG
jgi:hypothetical protein